MVRKLTATINSIGDVTYDLFRDKPFSKYLIEHPHQDIVLINDKELSSSGCFKTINNDGYLLLTWDNPTIQQLTYKKIGRAKQGIYDESFETNMI